MSSLALQPQPLPHPVPQPPDGPSPHPGQSGDDLPAGRTCPLHYRYRPEDLAGPTPQALRDLDVLYVVGGLYGNVPALERVLAMFAAEAGRKALVFNGDFHWFDVDTADFARVQREVLAHTALRGNVETELGQTSGLGAGEGPDSAAALPDAAADDDAVGCGCGYPEWVADAVVERSNRILQRLRRSTTAAQRAELAALPMWTRAEVGGLRLAIVHGDAHSLAGWDFSVEHLRDAAHRARLSDVFDRARADAFACTHTCLPVFQPFAPEDGGVPRWVFNNGSAGMPNFHADTAGLITRVARTPLPGPARRFGVTVPAPTARAGRPEHEAARPAPEADRVHVDAVAVPVDAAVWQARFLAQWPPGSDAHTSYFQRIVHGPAHSMADALRRLDQKT